MMMDPDGKAVPIQFICHSPECHLCHFKQRKGCLACDTPRDTGLEPTVYDPQVHNSYIAQRRIITMMVPTASAAPSGAKAHATSEPPLLQQSGAKAHAFPPDWDQIDISSECQDLDMHGTEENPQAVAHAATLLEEKDVLKTWHPTCLTKANVRLCLHEGSQEVLL